MQSANPEIGNKFPSLSAVLWNLNAVERIKSRRKPPRLVGNFANVENIRRSISVAHILQETLNILESRHLLRNSIRILLNCQHDNMFFVLAIAWSRSHQTKLLINDDRRASSSSITPTFPVREEFDALQDIAL